jgi:hypothetical protein
MGKTIATAAAIAVMAGIFVLPAFGQNSVTVPGVSAPVPLPPQPTVNPQPPGSPPRLDTYGDKATRCLHFGASHGLQAGARDAYSRACANN